jgi:hypothetical protein
MLVVTTTQTMDSPSCVLKLHQPKWTAASIIREFTLYMIWKYNNWLNEITYLAMARSGWTILGNTQFTNYCHDSELGERGWRAWSPSDDSHARQWQRERNDELEPAESPLVAFKKRPPFAPTIWHRLLPADLRLLSTTKVCVDPT